MRGKKMPRNELLNTFYDKCYEKAHQQVFPLESDQSIKCTIQSFRYVLREFIEDHGLEGVNHITRDWCLRKTNHSTMDHAKYL